MEVVKLSQWKSLTPEQKAQRNAKRIIRRAKPEYKARQKELNSRPEFKAARCAYRNAYRNRPDILARDHEKNRNYRAKLRDDFLLVFGGKCVRCGFSDKRALQIDHVNGDGYIERKKKGG